MHRFVAVALLVFLALTGRAQAAPVFVTGNECPADPLSGFTRQYYVSDATHCVYDSTANIQGDAGEAAMLDGAPAAWDGLTNWTGLGQNPTGFTYTADAGNDDGFFTIGAPLTTLYNQFAVGIKDGGSPKWAIFLLPVNDFQSFWGFSTNGGSLSHFALYGHRVTPPGDDDPPPDDDDPPPSVPEPVSLSLLGVALAGFGYRLRRRA